MAKLSDLVGKVCTKVQHKNKHDNEETIVFVVSPTESYEMKHFQDCCESVFISEITGDLSDLVGVPIVMADESTNSAHTEDGSETWTFYKFATIKGYVDITWRGESNGYYSESVDFIKIEIEKKKKKKK